MPSAARDVGDARADRADADDAERAAAQFGAGVGQRPRRGPALACAASCRARRGRAAAAASRRCSIRRPRWCSMPGRLATGMPRAVAASTGIRSRPTPWRTTARRRGAWSNEVVRAACCARSARRRRRPCARSVAGRRVGRHDHLAVRAPASASHVGVDRVGQQDASGLSAIRKAAPATTGLARRPRPSTSTVDRRARPQPGRRRVHGGDAGRRAGGDDVAGLERHAGATRRRSASAMSNSIVARRAVLQRAAVDVEPDADARAGRAARRA